jgi:hypothetical protein
VRRRPVHHWCAAAHTAREIADFPGKFTVKTAHLIGTRLAPAVSAMKKGYTWLLIGRDSTPGQPTDGEEIRLFARGDESVRITSHARTLTIHVFGPGRLQKSHDFGTADTLGKFRESLEQQMLSSGWTLLGVPDRRKALIAPIEQVEERRP